MIINSESLNGLFRGFNTSFNKGMEGAVSHYRDVAMVSPSTTGETTYSWLGQLPRLREWLGDRVVNNLVGHGYTIKNKSFESTIAVQRTYIEDDQYGVYGPLLSEMGRAAGEHPDELTFSLLNAGFTTQCYDGQNFFDTDHPFLNPDGTPGSASNMQAGSGPAWFLLDTSRAIRPLIFQERMKYELQSLDHSSDPNVFWRDEYIYGVRARANAGFGLWQLAFGSKAALNSTNYAAARSAMQSLRGDSGRLLGVRPTVLVVPSDLESSALTLLRAELGSGGESNIWLNTAELIVTPWLSA